MLEKYITAPLRATDVYDIIKVINGQRCARNWAVEKRGIMGEIEDTVRSPHAGILQTVLMCNP